MNDSICPVFSNAEHIETKNQMLKDVSINKRKQGKKNQPLKTLAILPKESGSSHSIQKLAHKHF